MPTVTFRKGDTIFREGDPGTHCYRIISGKVQVSLSVPSVMHRGKKTEIAVCGPREFIGEMSLLLGAVRSATVTALEDTTCESFTEHELTELLLKDPQEAMTYLRTLLHRLREDNRKLALTFAGRG